MVLICLHAITRRVDFSSIMKVLFVADAISDLNPKGDSTLVMVRASIALGQDVYWCQALDVELHGTEVVAKVQRVIGCAKDELPEVEGANFLKVEEFNALLIRKDPPFDPNYTKLCWLLTLLEHKVGMMNRPSLLLRFQEKMIPMEAVAAGSLSETEVIPTHIGSYASAKNFVRTNGYEKVISKPFYGYAGKNVMLFDSKTFLAGPENASRDDLMVQPFLAKVREVGDRRVFFLNGEIIADVVRMPKKGGFISNFAQGGSGISCPLTDKERDVLERLGKFLKSVNIQLAGADLIGTQISEVNVTSPTGLRAFEAIGGNDFGKEIMEFVANTVSK